MKDWMTDYTRRSSHNRLLRATWGQLSSLLAGEEVGDWAQVRSLRLDGPLATFETLSRMAERGLLDQIIRLELTSATSSDDTLRLVAGLASLKSLRLEGFEASGELAEGSCRLEELELLACSAEVCGRMLGSSQVLDTMRLVSPTGDPSETPDLLRRLAPRAMKGLTLANLSLNEGQLLDALQSSRESLDQLHLIQTTGIRSARWLSGSPWSALSALSLISQTIERLDGSLPESLRFVDLSNSSVREFACVSLPARLEGINLQMASLPPAFFEQMRAAPTKWRQLGLSGTAEMSALLSDISAEPGCALESLKLSAALGPEGLIEGQWRVEGQCHLESLRDFHCRGWVLDHQVWCALLYGEGAGKLETLSWSGYRHFESVPGKSLSPSLRSLSLEGGGSVELVQGDAPSSLESLSINGLKIEGDLGQFLSGCPRLKGLALEMVEGLDIGWFESAMPALASRLEILGVSSFESELLFEDELAEEMRRLGSALTKAKLLQLRELRLDETNLDMDSFERLIDRRTTPQLQVLQFGPEPTGERLWRAIVSTASADLQELKVNSEASEEVRYDLLAESRLSHARVSLI